MDDVSASQGPANAWLDEANTITSRGAEFLRGWVERAVSGEQALVEELRPLADYWDSLFANGSNPLPAPPPELNLPSI